MPAIPGLFAGVLAGCAMAFLQGLHPGDILNALQNGYEPSFAQTIADGETAAAVTQVLAEKGLTLNPDLAKEVGGSLVELLARGGMQSMNWTISLILCAFTFGGVLERCGFLEVLLHAALKPVKSVTGLVFATFVACFGTNLFLGDQYLSIVMPGRMFKPAYDERGLHGRMLSRSLEDFGTITSVLIPWNTCGAYNSTVLGVPTVEYLPYAFLNYLNPIVSVGMTALGIGISWKGKDGEVVIARSRPNE